MMKQQHSATSLRPIRLCQILMGVLALKLALLGGMAFDSFFEGMGGSVNNAYAADSMGAPAAPVAIDAQLPDVGMEKINTGTVNNPTIPGAVPGGSAPITAASNGTKGAILSDTGRGLPPLATPQATTGGGNTQDEVLRQSLLRQQEDVNRKEEALQQMEKDLAARMEQMQVLESRLQVMMKDAGQTQDAKLNHLVDVLSNMKSRQAAQVLETLDPRIGVKVLANMRGRQAGEILTYVEPKKAANLAEALSRMQLPME